MTRIAATSVEDFKFQINDTQPIRTQKLELMRQGLLMTSKQASKSAPSYILADGLQALDTPLFPDTLPPMLIGNEVAILNDSAGFQYDQSIVLGTRDWLEVATDRNFQTGFRARMAINGSIPGSLSIGFLLYSSGGIYLGSIPETLIDADWVVADGPIDGTASTDSAAILALFPNAVYVRGYILPESKGGTYIINRPTISDITTNGDLDAAVDAAEAAAAAALASAISASLANTTAAGYASSASASASTATGQASAATASAVAAQSFANNASTSATASSVSASAASTSATAAGSSASAANISAINAATQATNASGSASAANTSASSAASSSTAAGNSATAANTAKLAAEAANTAATASASAASSSAASASSSAATATSQATLSASFATAASGSATTASTQAGIATSAAATATAQAAIATSNTVLTASLAFNALNKNSNFLNWPGGTGTIPDDWGNWQSGTSSSRVAGDLGGYAYQGANSVGNEQGIFCNPAAMTGLKSTGFFVVDAEFTLVSGAITSSGFYLSNGSQAFTQDFAAFIDPVTGSPIGAGTVGRRYKVSKMYEFTVANSAWILYLMTSWGSFPGGNAAKSLKWHHLLVREATPAEIRDQTVLAPLSATVSTQATAIALLNGYTEARWVTTAVAGTGRAQLEIYADANGGGGVDIIGDVKIDGDLLVTGSVTSSELGSNAASNGTVVYNAGSVTLSTSWQDAAEVTLSMIGGAAKIDFAAYVAGQGENSGTNVLWRLLRNGTEIRSGTLLLFPGEQTVYGGTVGVNPYPVYTPIAGMFPAFHVDTSGATGSVNYKVQLKLNTADTTFSSFAERQMSVTEFRR